MKIRINVRDEIEWVSKKIILAQLSPQLIGFLPFEGQENELNKQDTVIVSVSSCVTKFCCNLLKA